jgi:predicted DNA-binding transcriptional regulator AlpA
MPKPKKTTGPTYPAGHFFRTKKTKAARKPRLKETMAKDLPEHGLVRLPTVLAVFPVSRSAWWDGIKNGKYPAGIKLGPRTTVWDAAAIRQLIEDYK